MGTPIVQVDAFTNKPFSGNPAAVCLLSRPTADNWMKDVAREMNLSETAFLCRQEDGYNLRWFTPTIEVDLCGHATLASAHVLWEEGHRKPQEAIRFSTKSGRLTATRDGDWIKLDLPAKHEEPAVAPVSLLDALGVQAEYIGKHQSDYIVLVSSEEIVRRAKPNHSMLRTLPVRAVILTGHSSTAGFDFVSRFFAPGSGIDEDPVTGSAHCCLGPFWSARLGKKELTAYQASDRGGIIQVSVRQDRVVLGGQAVTVMRGTIL